MIVCVDVVVSPAAQQEIEKKVRSLNGRVVFAQNKTSLEQSPTIVFGYPSLDDLKRLPRLKWVQSAAAGVDELVLGGGFPEGVLLTSGRGVYGVAGGEHILGMMLYFARGLYFYHGNQRRGQWVRDYAYAQILQGRTLVVLGLGDIGQQVAKRAAAFGMRVLGVKRTPGSIRDVEKVFTTEALDEVLPHADHLAITLPLTPETKGLIDRRRLELLPDGAYVYNVGRGAIVDEEAMVSMLQSGRLGGAGLDVFVEEPLKEGHPLWDMENVLITPHVGANTRWDMDAAVALFLDNLQRFSEGAPLRNVIDPNLGY